MFSVGSLFQCVGETHSNLNLACFLYFVNVLLWNDFLKFKTYFFVLLQVKCVEYFIELHMAGRLVLMTYDEIFSLILFLFPLDLSMICEKVR